MTLRRRRATDCKPKVPDHQGTRRERFFIPMRFRGVEASGDWSHQVPEWLQLFKEGLSGEQPDAHNVVVEQPAVEPKEKTLGYINLSSEEESTDLPFIAERSKRPNTSTPIGRHHVFFTHFPKNPNCEVCKLTRPDAQGYRISRLQHGFKATPRKTMKTLQKFEPPDQKPCSTHTENSLEFIRACEDLCWNRDKSTPSISSGIFCKLGSGTASSWWKSVSHVSMELERVDDLANSVCDQ